MYNAGLSHFLCHFLELSYPALTLFIADDLGLPLEKVIIIGFPLYLFLGLFAVPWGIISDRTGPYLALGISCLVSGAGSLGMFFSKSIGFISLSLCLIGLGIAAFHPVGMAAISSTYKERRGRALAVHGIWGGFGILTAPAISAIIAYYFNWRSFYLFAALISLSTSVWAFKIQKQYGEMINENKETKETLTISKFISSMLKTFRYREFFLLIICMSIAGLVYRANITALPILLKENSGEILKEIAEFLKTYLPSKDSSDPINTGTSLLMGIAIAGGLFGQKVAGWCADKYNLTKCYFYCFLLAIPCLILMGLVTGNPLILITFIYFIFGLGMQPIENSLVAELSPKEILSSVYGIKFLFSFGIAAVIVYPVGTAAEGSHFTQLYLFLAALLILHVFIVSKMTGWRESS